MDSNTSKRIIHTNLYGKHAFEVIDSLHGQLSDGKWENSPGYDKYWTNFDVKIADDSEVIFEVNANSCSRYCNKWLNNPFYAMSDSTFKTWIARKIKAVVNDERRDFSDFGAWDRKNTQHISRYFGHTDEKYGTVLNVADIYCTYEALLGREIGITNYDSSTICRVFGNKRTDEEIAKIKNINEKKKSINARYAVMRDELQRAKNEAVAKLEKELQDKIAKLNAKCNDEIAALTA